jgi:molecular chaperone HscB
MDPFATLGIARGYAIDLAAVERNHRELSRALHPDRFVGAGASERRAALAKAVEVNEAWRTVRDPIRRAQALLSLAGVSAGEDAVASPGAGAPQYSPLFLMEMLEGREALQEARQARDRDAIRRLAQTVEGRASAAERALSEGFVRGDLETAVAKLGEMRFYRRFLDEVSAIEDEWAA